MRQKTVTPVCVISRCAAVAVSVLSVTVQFWLPPPPQPTCWAVGVGGATTEALRLLIVPRPLWSALPRSAVDTDPGCAGTGFWPGAAFPPWFVHVYVAVPAVAWNSAIAGTLPSPLKLPPVSVTVSPLKLAVGKLLTLTAATAIEAPNVSAAAASATNSQTDFLISFLSVRDEDVHGDRTSSMRVRAITSAAAPRRRFSRPSFRAECRYAGEFPTRAGCATGGACRILVFAFAPGNYGERRTERP